MVQGHQDESQGVPRVGQAASALTLPSFGPARRASRSPPARAAIPDDVHESPRLKLLFQEAVDLGIPATDNGKVWGTAHTLAEGMQKMGSQGDSMTIGRRSPLVTVVTSCFGPIREEDEARARRPQNGRGRTKRPLHPSWLHELPREDRRRRNGAEKGAIRRGDVPSFGRRYVGSSRAGRERYRANRCAGL
jgi:hypothetical protein